MTLKELLSYIDFDVIKVTKENGEQVLMLKDRLQGNLGDIESEEFPADYNGVRQIIDRCEIYWRDCVVSSLCEDMHQFEFDFGDWEDIYESAKIRYGDKVDEVTILGYIVSPDRVSLDKEIGE